MRAGAQKIILISSFLALPMTVAAQVVSSPQGSTTTKQAGNVVSAQNQGEDTQLQNTVQVNNPENGSMTQTQEQIQLQTQIQESKPSTISAKSNSQARTDISASAIENMVKLANSLENEGIADKIKEIAKVQGESVDTANNSLEKAESRSSFAEFFIGPNYGELKTVKGEIERNQLRIRELQSLKIQLSNEGDQTELQNQINLLEQQNINLQNELDLNDGGFSLLGWFFKLINKY